MPNDPDWSAALVLAEKILRELNIKIASKRFAEAHLDILAAIDALQDVNAYVKRRK